MVGYKGEKPRALDVTFFDVWNGVMMSVDSGFGALSVRGRFDR
jgi:hypothetical protein